MKKIILLTMVIFGYIYACNCKFDKEKIRCDYYVYKNHDLSHKKSCLSYAKDSEMSKVYDKAAFYYLLGGDIKKAKDNAKEAIKLGYKFANEYLGFAYLLENDTKNAKKAFKALRDSSKDINYIKRDITALKTLYSGFDIEKANEMLFK